MKRYFHGTHRIVSPETTLRRAHDVASAAGVTRLADLTGLDRIGLPIFQAVRPMACSLAVAMGKGLTEVAAKVSALMEAIEFDAAERVPSATVPSSAAALGVAPLWTRLLPAHGRDRFDPNRPRGWLDAIDLRSGKATHAPRGLVAHDLTEAAEADLGRTTNGLASGNSRDEAIAAAMAELIERDSEAAWSALPALERSRFSVDLASVDAPAAAAVAARVLAAGCDLHVWDTGERHGVPAFVAIILQRPGTAPVALSPALGGGCHPDAEIAFTRAVCEAAQSRAMQISGARDDLDPALFVDPVSQTRQVALAMLTMRPPERRWGMIRGQPGPTSRADIAWLLARLPADQPVIVVALTSSDAPLHVVKLLAPGLACQRTRAP